MHPLLRPAAPSRRRVLAGAGAALVLSALLPTRTVRAEAQGPAEGAGALAPKPGTRVAAFLEIHPNGMIKLLSPFVEGGQGIATAWRRSSAKNSTCRPPASSWNARRPASTTPS